MSSLKQIARDHPPNLETNDELCGVWFFGPLVAANLELLDGCILMRTLSHAISGGMATRTNLM